MNLASSAQTTNTIFSYLIPGRQVWEEHKESFCSCCRAKPTLAFSSACFLLCLISFKRVVMLTSHETSISHHQPFWIHFGLSFFFLLSLSLFFLPTQIFDVSKKEMMLSERGSFHQAHLYETALKWNFMKTFKSIRLVYYLKCKN